MIKFIGRLNSEGRQNFRSGLMICKGKAYKAQEEQYRPVIGPDGKPTKDANGLDVIEKVVVEVDRQNSYRLQVKDIGKEFDAGDDEPYLLERYPLHFEKK